MLVRSLPPDTPPEVLKRVGGWSPATSGAVGGQRWCRGTACSWSPPAQGPAPHGQIRGREGVPEAARPVPAVWGLVPSCGRPPPARAAGDPDSLPVVPAPLGRAHPSAPAAADRLLGVSGSERLR